MEEKILAVLMAALGTVLGYLLNVKKMDMASHVSEKDLLARIDLLQANLIELTRENANLRNEISALRDEISALRTAQTQRRKVKAVR